MRKKQTPKRVEDIKHSEAKRKNIPPADSEPLVDEETKKPIPVAYERRNKDLDPQLVWSGKDEAYLDEMIVQAPPLYTQEKIEPKALIDDLMRASKTETADDAEPALFDANGFDGLDDEKKTEYYQHDANWSNRMILGDSLRVMASLAEREAMRGKVQCVYIDPPYGIKFNSNFQWSTSTRNVKDGDKKHITREPEQVKAFRDAWENGVHSYLSYLRDRLAAARELLTESGSCFVQIGDENVHRVRAVMDEVFGPENAFAMIPFKKKNFTTPGHAINDYILHYAKDKGNAKYNITYLTLTDTDDRPDDPMFKKIMDLQGKVIDPKDEKEEKEMLRSGGRWFRIDKRLISQHPSPTRSGEIEIFGEKLSPGSNAHWAFDPFVAIPRLGKAGRLHISASGRLDAYVFWNDVPRRRLHNFWDDTSGELRPQYVVQTNARVVQRCILMTTDPGDLVLDPTCGSGTTAYVAEKFGRRWIMIDTSRIALTLARMRLMGAFYPYYYLADSSEGQQKEAQIERRMPSEAPTYGDIRQGFVYRRVPRITLGDIANNAEIDVIWDQHEEALQPLRAELSKAADLPETLEEWEVPRDPPADWPAAAEPLLARFWELRAERQREIDASIAAKAEYETLYDQPYEDKKRTRVAGPFTIDSLSPVRSVPVGADGKLRLWDESRGRDNFVETMLKHLKTAGIDQTRKEWRIRFDSLEPWSGDHIAAAGVYTEGGAESGGAQKQAGVYIGPEYNSVSRRDLVDAAKEAADAGMDILIACAFSYDPQASAVVDGPGKMGRMPVLKAAMNADLHMSGELKSGKTDYHFTVFGEPDVEIRYPEEGMVEVEIKGVDIYDPLRGEPKSGDLDAVACWFIDTDYNGESFFIRHAYFWGAEDPYKQLKTALKAEIDEEAWESLRSCVSRPFPRPSDGRIAVKVINHLGDEAIREYELESSP